MGKQDKARRVYTTEFKAEAAAPAGEHGKPARQIALDLGINENQLYRWTQRAREADFFGEGGDCRRFPDIPPDEGAASLRTKEPRPSGRRRRVPTDEGGASPRTKEARPHGRRSRVPTDGVGTVFRAGGGRVFRTGPAGASLGGAGPAGALLGAAAPQGLYLGAAAPRRVQTRARTGCKRAPAPDTKRVPRRRRQGVPGRSGAVFG
jgi:transposase-like protein